MLGPSSGLLDQSTLHELQREWRAHWRMRPICSARVVASRNLRLRTLTLTAQSCPNDNQNTEDYAYDFHESAIQDQASSGSLLQNHSTSIPFHLLKELPEPAEGDNMRDGVQGLKSLPWSSLFQSLTSDILLALIAYAPSSSHESLRLWLRLFMLHSAPGAGDVIALLRSGNDHRILNFQRFRVSLDDHDGI